MILSIAPAIFSGYWILNRTAQKYESQGSLGSRIAEVLGLGIQMMLYPGAVICFVRCKRSAYLVYNRAFRPEGLHLQGDIAPLAIIGTVLITTEPVGALPDPNPLPPNQLPTDRISSVGVILLDPEAGGGGVLTGGSTIQTGGPTDEQTIVEVVITIVKILAEGSAPFNGWPRL